MTFYMADFKGNLDKLGFMMVLDKVAFSQCLPYKSFMGFYNKRMKCAGFPRVDLYEINPCSILWNMPVVSIQVIYLYCELCLLKCHGIPPPLIVFLAMYHATF